MIASRYGVYSSQQIRATYGEKSAGVPFSHSDSLDHFTMAEGSNYDGRETLIRSLTLCRIYLDIASVALML